MGSNEELWDKKREATRRRKELRGKAIAYKGGSCTICRYDACANALEFHHLNPLEKDFTISRRMTSWRAIKRELDKCVLLCSRCHREVHDGMHTGFLEDPDTARSQLDVSPEHEDELTEFYL